MTDARLRELERRAGSGDVEAAAAALVERRRAGLLSQARLDLAALLGDPAGLLAGGRGRGAGEPRVVSPPSLEARRDHAGRLRWVDWFADALASRGAGAEGLVRAALAATGRALGEVDTEPFGRTQAALAATRAWLGCPCDRHGDEARAAATLDAGGCVVTRGRVAGWGAAALAAAAGARAEPARQEKAREALVHALTVLMYADVPEPTRVLLDAAAAELVPWALAADSSSGPADAERSSWPSTRLPAPPSAR